MSDPVYRITSWTGDTGQADHFEDAKSAIEAAAHGWMEDGDRLVWSDDSIFRGGKVDVMAQIYADHEPTDSWWQIEEM